MNGACYDAAIVGGGINGCGIARDAAGRGLSVLLLEQNDLASGTSSASTKLIHGGLRYLEHGAFRLVRESLREREILMHIAPHLVRPMRFVLPHTGGLRPAWLMRFGLFLYDCMGGKLPRSRTINLKHAPDGEPLSDIARGRGFEYYDCWTDDARLVVANAKDAARRGAHILTRARCERARGDSSGWRLIVRKDGNETTLRAKCLINAAGPWAGHFLRGAANRRPAKLRLVQGSHLVLPKLCESDCGYVLSNRDRRIIFALPYANDFTLVGTTDRDFDGMPEDARVDSGEENYLLSAVRRFFRRPVSAADVVRKFCGVRPLYEDGEKSAQKASRDYALRLEYVNRAPLLNVFGGKLTTYRRLAQKAVDKLRQAGALHCGGEDWTAQQKLPGGDLPPGGAEEIARNLQGDIPQMRETDIRRLACSYGADALQIFSPLRTANGGGNEHFGGGLYASEVDYLMREEWARTAEDVLWRRSCLGLSFPVAAVRALDGYMRERREAAVS